MKKVLKVAKPILVALLGIALTNKFNIIEQVTNLPEDKAFDICLTAYFSVIEILSNALVQSIRSKFMSEIKVILYLENADASLDSTPVIKFNMSNLAEANILIQITGLKSHFLNSKIVIPCTSFATMQPNSRSQEVSIDELGNYIVDLEKMFGEVTTKTTLSTNFRIIFSKEPLEDERAIIISPELKTSKRLSRLSIAYGHNKAQLKVER